MLNYLFIIFHDYQIAKIKLSLYILSMKTNVEITRNYHVEELQTFLTLGYNSLTFPARIKKDSILFYFSTL
jgi:hypothetical protein